MFPAMVRRFVSLRWSEEDSFGARAFYKHPVPTGRGTWVRALFVSLRVMRVDRSTANLEVRKADFHPSGAAPLGTPGLPPLF
jgi:hypothetical protein